MIQVGVRQLKNSLTRYLRLVEKGQSVLVTSRNRPVAVLKRPDRSSARTQEELIAALVAEGNSCQQRIRDLLSRSSRCA